MSGCGTPSKQNSTNHQLDLILRILSTVILAFCTTRRLRQAIDYAIFFPYTTGHSWWVISPAGQLCSASGEPSLPAENNDAGYINRSTCEQPGCPYVDQNFDPCTAGFRHCLQLLPIQISQKIRNRLGIQIHDLAFAGEVLWMVRAAPSRGQTHLFHGFRGRPIQSKHAEMITDWLMEPASSS